MCTCCALKHAREYVKSLLAKRERRLLLNRNLRACVSYNDH